MFSSISIPQLLIILAIIVLLFGTKKLSGLGKDVGSAVKGFKDAMKEGETEQQRKMDAAERSGTTLDAQGKPVKEQDKA